MKRNIARLFVLCTQIILIGAFACLIASALGNSWLENSDNTYTSSRIYFGLLSLCGSDQCLDRQNVLDFKDVEWPLRPLTSYDFDVILLTFIISMVFVCIALFISLLLCCTTNGRKRWRVICSLVALMALIAVVSSLIGIAYFEGKISDERLSPLYKHGWSSIIAWLGFALLVIDTVLLLVVTCVKPDDHSKKPHSVKSTASYVSSENDAYASSRVNKGFETRNDQVGAFYVGSRKQQKSNLKTSVPLNTYEKAKTYRPTTNLTEPDYGSPRGSNNYVYESDYRSSDHDYEVPGRNEETVYDPRTRASGKVRRKRSFELAYDKPPSPRRDGKRHTNSSGYPKSSEYSSRRQTRSTEYDTSRQLDDTDYEDSRQMNTAGYDPRRTDASPYNQDARTPSRYNPSSRTPRSGRYPNMDSDGYQVR